MSSFLKCKQIFHNNCIVVRGSCIVRICKLSFVRKALAVICPNRILEDCHLSESYLGRLSFVRILFWNIVICPNRILEDCHLSESYFGGLSFVRIVFRKIVICPNRILEDCHLSESYFGILSFVRIVFRNIVICPKVINNNNNNLQYDTMQENIYCLYITCYE